MGRGSWAFGAFVVAAATGGSAAAQVAPPAGAGVPGAGPTARAFGVQAQVLVEHDSNVTRESESAAALAKLAPSDTIYSPTLSVNFVMPVGRQAIFLNGSGSYLFHQNNTTLNNERVNLTGGVSLSAGPCGAVLRGGYSRGRNELIAPNLAPSGGGASGSGGAGPLLPTTSNLESTILNIETSEDAGLSLTCARASGLGIFAQAGQQWTSNSEMLSGSGGYRSVNVSVGASYQRPQFGSLTLGGIYSRTNYGDRIQPLLSPGGFETTGANLSFSRQLGGRIQAQGAVGYTHAQELSPPPVVVGTPPATDFGGVTYSAGVSFRATSQLQAKASFQRQVSPTLLSGNSFEVLTGYSLNLQYTLGTHITLTATAGRQQSQTNGAPTLAAAQSLTDSRVNDLSASVSYRFNKRLSMQLSGTRETRKSDNARFDYSNDRVALTLSSNF